MKTSGKWSHSARRTTLLTVLFVSIMDVSLDAQEPLKPDGAQADQPPQFDNDAKARAARDWVSKQEALVHERLLGGSWVVVSSSRNGGKFTPAYDCWEFNLDSNRYWSRVPGELSPVWGGPPRIDVTKSPMRIDFLSARRRRGEKDKDKMEIVVYPDIFKFEGNQLVWATPLSIGNTKEGGTWYYGGQPLNQKGEYSDRPKDFEPAKGKEIRILRKNDTELYQGPLPGEKGESPGRWVDFTSPQK